MHKPNIEIPTISFEYRHGTRYAIMYWIYCTCPLTACVQVLIENSCSAVMFSELVAKSGTKSINWDYFRLERGKNGKSVDDGNAICRCCRKCVMVRQGNTLNLLICKLRMENFILDPRYDIPSRSHFSRTALPNLYVSTRKYFRLRKWDWKRVHVCTINTSTPCWNGNEHIDHAHLFQRQSPTWNWCYGSRLTSMQADSGDKNDRLDG